MIRDWHCPEGCTGVGLYQGACPDDLGPDEPCVNGILDDEEYKASEDSRDVPTLFKTEEEIQTMVDFNKLRANRDQKDRTQQKTSGVVKPLPRTFVVLDLETTGFDRVNDRIIEIGAVRFTDGEPVAIFNTLVNPEVLVSEEITKLTGHTNEDLLKGMSEDHAIITLIYFLRSEPIVGHNVLFDYELFYRAAGRIECGVCNPLIDTLTIARDRHKYPHKLPDMCKRYNVHQEGWHSAYFDALACGDLLLAMHAEDKNYPEGKQVADYTNVIGWKRQYGEPKWGPSWVTLKGQGDMHVQEGPRKARQVMVPKHDKPDAKWFGKGCAYQACQFEESGVQGEGVGFPVLTACSHPEASQSIREDNCQANMLCPMGLSDDLPF